MDNIFELILKDEAPIYESKMNAYLEENVAKYLHSSDDYASLTNIARKHDADNLGITSKQGKGGGTMAHLFIASDFEMWNDSEFRYEVLEYFATSFLYKEDESTNEREGQFMILDISDSSYKNILNDEQLFLPIRWNGVDFSETLENLFNRYIRRLETVVDIELPYHYKVRVDMKEVKKVTGLLIKTTNYYLNGFPAKAFNTFEQVMGILARTPLRIYQKSAMEQFGDLERRHQDDLRLFRAVRVADNKPYQRTRVFHTPYNLRSKVSTNRYSIAGYPSLYLGTSLDLCCKEIKADPNKDLVLAAAFKLERTIEYTNTNIQVIELGVKPQDFLNITAENLGSGRRIPIDLVESVDVRSAYLLWYPLIAACSFIRTNKNDPFAAEYIIPQLLMQWVRSEINSKDYEDYDNLIGIRYFSCASVKASDMGFNYVFPTSGRQKSYELPYCDVLTKAFCLTNPVYIHEYDTISACERKLLRSTDFDFIS